MKKLFVVVLAWAGLASSAWAEESRPCWMQRGESCWFAENKSKFSVRIDCQDKYNARFYKTLTPGMETSHQFNPAWGDSLGYPEPGVVSNCEVVYSNHERVAFSIRSIDWGNTVTITFRDSAVEVRRTTRRGESLLEAHAVGF